MCGIFGKFSFQSNLDVNASIKALDLIQHRGPDGFGIEFGHTQTGYNQLRHNEAPTAPIEASNFFLGHRRLSIVDLSDNAFQPMHSQCNKYSIIFNGEIYNYIELRKLLVENGYEFQTDHSDTEVLLTAYIHWGKDCVKHFRGMFAFAIYDKTQEQVFFARDRIGQKSLYYELNEYGLSFASELPPLIDDENKREINATALGLYLQLGYVPHPHSIFQGILKLAPATSATFDLNTKSLETTEYWDVGQKDCIAISPDQAVLKTKEALRESVAYRLRADVTVGAFISGGTDSTLIVKGISEASGQQSFDIYGADFPGTDRSEKPYIEEAAQRYKQNLKLSAIDVDHIQNIDAIIKVFDEPFDGASSIALFDLFAVATKDHKVILTGDGGDEMFAGYDRYLEFIAKNKKVAIIKALKLPELALSFINHFLPLQGKLKSLFTQLKSDPLSNFTGLSSNTSQAMLKPQFRTKELSQLEPFNTVQKSISAKGLSLLKSLQYLELKTILPGRMLYKVDRFSMFYGVEARSPFLDHKLAELAYSLPDTITTEDGIPKAVLKKLLSEDFDDSFVHRTKMGFGNPLSKWFKKGNHAEIFRLLLDKNSKIYNYLDYQATQKLFPQFQEGYKGEGEKSLWRMLVLAHYLENYKDRIAI